MGDRNLWSKLGLIVVIIGLSLWQLYPLEKRLKPGIDLGGGHSLLFEIDDTDIKEYDLAQRVMTVLKNRVDPQGNRNLVWRPIGRNRLEIQMPRPPEGLGDRRKAYETARAAIRVTNITEMQVRNALSLTPEERQKAFKQMAESYPSRAKLFDRLVEADERYKRLSAEFASLPPASSQPATKPAGETGTRPATQAATQPAADTQKTALAGQIDDAFNARTQAIQELLATNLDERVLGDLLRLLRGDAKRIEGIRKIKEAHPDLEPFINKTIAAYDAYADDKGALDDPSDLIRLLRGAGVLEFRILATIDPSNRQMLDSSNGKYVEQVGKYIEQLAKFGPRPQPGDNYQWFEISPANVDDFIRTGSYVVQEYLGTKYVLAHSTKDMGLIKDADKPWSLRSAMAGRDRRGRMAVDFRLGGGGPAMFGELTSNNIGRPLTIFLDGKAMSAAIIMSAIYDSGQISGTFSQEDIAYLINTLEAGALPARLKEVPLQEKSIGPALGQTNRLKGEQAIIISFILTIAFMAVYYTYNGFIADIALLMNLIITLGVMSFLQATFTLPGIAGLVLTLGMAVDANVLIYERMREELARGVSVRMAVKLGYEKAFSAILDSNVTTIITAVILVALGSEEIKGFGLTLGIGLCTSMFTALFVTRQYLHVMVPATVSTEETRRVWLGTGILVAAGGLILATGYVFSSPEALRHSTLFGLGTFLAWMAGTAVALVVSIWLFRMVYRVTGHQQGGRLPMFKLFEAPKIKWMAKYRIFWTISAVVIGLGVIFVASVPHKTEFLDIEFIGGTTVQVELNKEHQDVTDEQLLTYITGDDRSRSVGWLSYSASQLDQATVKPAGEGRFLIGTPEEFTTAQLRALLLPELGEYVERGGLEAAETGQGVIARFKPITVNEKTGETRPVTQEEAQGWVAGAANYARSAANRLRGTRVQLVEEETETGQTRKAFELITTETQRALVAEALLASMSDILEVTRSIEATVDKLDQDPEHTRPDGIFPIPQEANVLSNVIGGDARDPIQDYKGGVALVFKELKPPQTSGAIEQRLREMRLQPDFEGVSWRDKVKVVGLDAVDPNVPRSDSTLFTRLAILVNDPQLPYAEGGDNTAWRSEVAERELDLAQAAFASTRSLQRVTQFAPQVAEEAAVKAIIAIVLSMLAIAVYVWVRFGSADFGVAGIIALYHDVAVALTCVMACHYVYNTAIGKLLMLQDFKIDLNIIAALLTIVGYSINDTIVIFDRIRENRGRLATVSDSLIDNSLNQTLSRTFITSWTVFMVVVVMYIFGGDGIHGFAFAMLIGTISGVYSTLGVATPMLRHPRAIWITTIVLGGLTLTGLVWLIPHAWVCWTLTAIIAAVALVGLVKQFAAMRGEPVRRTATA